MNQFIRFIKRNSYYISNANSKEMYILKHFLIDDFGTGWQSFKDFVFVDQEDTCSNASFLIKQGNNIRIEDLYDNRDTGDKPAFIISKDEYLKLLDMWVEVYNQKPDEILITYENGKIDVKAINIK